MELSKEKQLKFITDFLDSHNIVYKKLDVIKNYGESGLRCQYELRTPVDYLNETSTTYVTPILEVTISEESNDMTFRGLSVSNDVGEVLNSEYEFGKPQNAFTESGAFLEDYLWAILLELFKFNRTHNTAIAKIESHIDAIQQLCEHYDIPMADFVNIVYDFNSKKSDQNSWTF